MRALALLFVVILGVSGCASHRPAPSAAQLSRKREEVEVLREEIDVVIRSLDKLQQDLVRRGDYPVEAQDRDLNYFISVVRQARDRVGAEDRRLHQQYGVSDEPYR